MVCLRHPHIYGIDLATTSELIAFRRSESEIAKQINADQVIYQSLPDLVAACAELSPTPGPRQFEVGVFTGKYITPVDEGYLEHLERVRGNKKKSVRNQAVVDVSKLERSLDTVQNRSDLNHVKKDILENVETTLDSINGATSEVEVGETQDPALHNLNDDKR